MHRGLKRGRPEGHCTAAPPGSAGSSRTLPGGQNDAYRSQKTVKWSYLGNIGTDYKAGEELSRCTRTIHPKGKSIARASMSLPKLQKRWSAQHQSRHASAVTRSFVTASRARASSPTDAAALRLQR